MVTPQLWKQWKITESNLANARRYLIQAAPEFESKEPAELQAFDEYISHNELGLALEEIAALGDVHPCRGAFWRSLELAAESMHLAELAIQYRNRFLAALRSTNAG